MRLFVAIKIPEEVKESFGGFISEIKQLSKLPGDLKWVQPENMHLTLKFIGETPPENLQKLKEAIAKAIEKQRKFSFEVKGIGAFPDLEKMRVLWAGITEESIFLTKLADKLELWTVSAGFAASDKLFVPHLTIARFNTPPQSTVVDLLRNIQGFNFGKVNAEGLYLMESHLSRSGPQYTDVEYFPFRPSHEN